MVTRIVFANGMELVVLAEPDQALANLKACSNLGTLAAFSPKEGVGMVYVNPQQIAYVQEVREPQAGHSA